MGEVISRIYWEGNIKEYIPPPQVTPGFDPNLGFKAPRKPRVSHMSEEEMKAMKMEKKYRDYCAHYYRDLLICRRQYSPIFPLCNPEKRALEHCHYEDAVLRMKEYEREKRLRIREWKKQGKTID